MPIVTKSFSWYHFVICELQWWVLVMDPRYIFVVQCHYTHTWRPRPLTSSLKSLFIANFIWDYLDSFLPCVVCDMGRHLCWFFTDFSWLLQHQVPRTTPCLLSILSPHISKPLFYAHKFKFLSKKEFYFIENVKFWPSGVLGQNIRPPWAEYPGRPDYPGQIRPDYPACMATTYIRSG
jgi:hypothetical protein